MSRINFGILKASLFHKLTESLDKNDELNSEYISFFEVIKSDPVLQVENIIYKNLLNKHISPSSESTIVRYIDENINLFKNFSREDFHKAHAKLEQFKSKVNPNYQPSNAKILNAIDSLLYESLSLDINALPNIDALHEAYEIVLEHIKQPKTTETQLSKVKQPLKESILKNAINKFNEKYSHLNESDKKLLSVLINPDNKAKKELFESLKNETHEKLMKSLEAASQAVQDRIKNSMAKIERMQFNEQNATKDIIRLHNLNKNGFSAE
jgi:hypothetical protein